MNTSGICELSWCTAQEKHDRMPGCSQVVLWGKKPKQRKHKKLWRLSTCISYIFPVKGSLRAFHGRRTEENKITATNICNQFQYCEKLLNLLQRTKLWPRFTFWKFFRTLFAAFHKFFPCQLFALKCKLQQKIWTLILGLVLCTVYS